MSKLSSYGEHNGFELSTKRNQFLIPCYGAKNFGQVFSLYIAPSYINEYLTTDNGGYLYEQTSREVCTLIAVRLGAS